MIKILIRKNPDKLALHLVAYGHAGTAPSGQDTVCAAVSALIYGFGAEVANIGQDGLQSRIVDIGDTPGKAVIEVNCINERMYKRLLYNLAPVERGLKILAQNNPEAVSLEIRS